MIKSNVIYNELFFINESVNKSVQFEIIVVKKNIVNRFACHET